MIDQIAASLTTIDDRIRETPGVCPQLLGLRGRLIGELLGDRDRILGALAPEFTLVRHVPGTAAAAVPADAFRASIDAFCAGGRMLWVDWDHLAVDRETLMGHGVMSSLSPVTEESPATLTTDRIAIVVEYRDGLMAVEHVYTGHDVPGTRTFDEDRAPTRAQMREALATRGLLEAPTVTIVDEASSR